MQPSYISFRLLNLSYEKSGISHICELMLSLRLNRMYLSKRIMPADKILSGIERLMSPKLNEILGELKAIHTRIDSTNERVDSLDAKMDTRINSLMKRR